MRSPCSIPQGCASERWRRPGTHPPTGRSPLTGTMNLSKAGRALQPATWSGQGCGMPPIRGSSWPMSPIPAEIRYTPTAGPVFSLPECGACGPRRTGPVNAHQRRTRPVHLGGPSLERGERCNDLRSAGSNGFDFYYDRFKPGWSDHFSRFGQRPCQQYHLFWRANAANASGTGVWSSVWSFTTTLAAPALSSP